MAPTGIIAIQRQLGHADRAQGVGLGLPEESLGLLDSALAATQISEAPTTESTAASSSNSGDAPRPIWPPSGRCSSEVGSWHDWPEANRHTVPAHATFTKALDRLARHDRVPPCGTPEVFHYWASDSAADRAIAIRGCNRCPLVEVCDAAATERRETFGVWGGIDRTLSPSPSAHHASPTTLQQ